MQTRGEGGVEEKFFLKPEFSAGDKGLFLLPWLKQQGHPTTGRREGEGDQTWCQTSA